MRSTLRRTAVLAAAALTALTLATPALGADAFPPTPGVPCDAGSLPESATQGRVPLSEVTNGRAAKGYTCNSRELGHFGNVGGFRVERYVDKAGHECAYYDTTLLIGRDALQQGINGTGVYVMDMTNPAKPTYVRTLATAAMDSPHESLRLNQKRGLLAAVLSTPATNAGAVDIYDVSADCRNPALKSSTPFGVLGHESGFSPDGLTFYTASLYFHTVAAIDVSDTLVPKLLWLTTDYQSHGISISDDGNRLYMAEAGFNDSDFSGLTILDTSNIQKRELNPAVPVVSRTTWPNVGTPQYAEPFTQNGHKYLMEIDEYGSGANVGAGRILDMTDEKKPVVISNMRLAVNQEKAQTGEQTADPGATAQFQGYRGHYCSLSTRVNPTIVPCTFIVSGLRVFDITDPAKPQEIAYFNGKVLPSSDPIRLGAFAMASPVYIPERREVWYSDGNLGFYSVRLTPAAKRLAAAPAVPPKRPVAKPAAPPSTAPGSLPTTGLPVALPALALVALGAYGLVRRRRAQHL
jgi:hypothetical protein